MSNLFDTLTGYQTATLTKEDALTGKLVKFQGGYPKLENLLRYGKTNDSFQSFGYSFLQIVS